MKSILIFTPKSNKTSWVFKSKINDKTRISVCLKKLDRLYHNQNNEAHQIAASYFHSDILKSNNFFNKEIDRMRNLIIKKTRSDIKFSGHCKERYEIVIGTQFSAALYALIQLFDDLMCLMKACYDLEIFQERSLGFRKTDHYKKCIKHIIHNVCQYKITDASLIDKIHEIV